MCSALFVWASSAAQAQSERIVIRPVTELTALANQVAHALVRRTGVDASVGAPPPIDLLQSVSVGEVAMGLEEDEIVLVLSVSPTRSVSTRLARPRDAGAASVRSVVLSLESLLELGRDASWAEEPTTEPRAAPQATDDERPPPRRERRRIPPIAKPTIYLRALLGYSPARSRPLLGPGTGLGLCVGPHCVVLEGDLSLLADRRPARDGRFVSYRSVNFSLRVQLRPFTWENITPGITFGLVTRIGNATIEGTDTSDLVTNLGTRGTIEVAWRFVPRFEAVLEGGIDIAIDRARFLRYGESVVLEDRVTPWFGFSVRLRP